MIKSTSRNFLWSIKVFWFYIGNVYAYSDRRGTTGKWTSYALEHLNAPTNVVLSKWPKLKTNFINLKAWGGMLGICSWPQISWHLISSLRTFQKSSTGVSAIRQLHTNYIFLWYLSFHLVSFLLLWKSTAFYFNKYIHIFLPKLRVLVHCVSKQILKG